MSRPGVLADLRRLGGDAGLVSLGQLVSYAYPIVSIPLLSRVLGVDGLGVFIVTLAVIQFLLVWTDFGFGFSALRRTAVAGSSAGRQAVAAATITAKLALWAAGSAVLLLIVLAVPQLRQHFGLYLLGAVLAIGAALYPMWYLQGTGRLKLFAVVTGGTRVVALIGLVLTVRSSDQLGLAVFWQFLPYLLSAAVCWLVLARSKDIALRFSNAADALAALRDSVPLFVSLISGQAIVNSSAILLAQFSGYRQVGLFGPADRLASAINGVVVAIEQSMMPRVTIAHELPQVPNQRRLILGGLAGCYGLAGLTLTVSAPVVIPWYLGAEFDAAVPVVQVMGLATVITGFARTCSLDLVAANRANVVSVVTTIAVFWHLVAASVGAWLAGALGVAVAICGTQLLMGGFMAIAIRRGPPRRPRHLRVESRFALTREK